MDTIIRRRPKIWSDDLKPGWMHQFYFKRKTSFTDNLGCGGYVWCQKLVQKINKAKTVANSMHTVCHNRDNLWFRVMEFDRSNQGIPDGQNHVHLKNRTCDRERFDTLRYPCTHVIAACQNLHLDLMGYVDEVYKLEYMYNM
ncbi:hypothetical protein J1N35_026176 [Gossypium stocksii]|uniref:Zinc finger PMZ-type domain-containing protein n=1 Tax=Gossypium stocksii TaxID=47602 RepID=A0A9D3ZYZ7_9ROSI|nr:hypothetical protein J1N35_026176 [Gossypium stocksii]